MDVRGLYPNVPREEAREAVRKALAIREDIDTDADTVL